MNLLTVWARKEPTTDEVAQAFGLKKKDTVFYRDCACKQLFARKPWWQSGHPRRNTRKVHLNCWPWALQWVHSGERVTP
jgi:hypothetical protein